MNSAITAKLESLRKGLVETEDAAPMANPKKYSDDPDAFNTKLSKLMSKLKKEIGAENVRQNYKGTGSKKHVRQLFVRLPYHPRGGPDVWLDNGYVKVGGVIDAPKSIPNVKKYGDEEPEAIYAWIRETLKAIIEYEKAKYPDEPKGEGKDMKCPGCKGTGSIKLKGSASAEKCKVCDGSGKFDYAKNLKSAQAKMGKSETVRDRMRAMLSDLTETSVADMDDEEVIKTARDLASKARKTKLSFSEKKQLATAMQRIKDEGMLSDDDFKEIWQMTLSSGKGNKIG